MDHEYLLKKLKDFFEEGTQEKLEILKQHVLHQESDSTFIVTISIRQI